MKVVVIVSVLSLAWLVPGTCSTAGEGTSDKVKNSQVTILAIRVAILQNWFYSFFILKPLKILTDFISYMPTENIQGNTGFSLFPTLNFTTHFLVFSSKLRTLAFVFLLTSDIISEIGRIRRLVEVVRKEVALPHSQSRFPTLRLLI